MTDGNRGRVPELRPGPNPILPCPRRCRWRRRKATIPTTSPSMNPSCRSTAATGSGGHELDPPLMYISSAKQAHRLGGNAGLPNPIAPPKNVPSRWGTGQRKPYPITPPGLRRLETPPKAPIYNPGMVAAVSPTSRFQAATGGEGDRRDRPAGGPPSRVALFFRLQAL